MATGFKSGGREKGTPNKVTASIKSAFFLAFQDLGGWPALSKWAQDDPKNLTEFYKLASKLIPTEISGIDGGPIETKSITDTADAILARWRENAQEKTTH